MIPILSILLCAVLWRMGGNGIPEFREFGVPITVALAKLVMVGQSYPIYYAPMLWVMLKLFSYGISAPPHKFWVWVFGKGADGNYKPVELMTRMTCGVFWLLPTIWFAIHTHNWMAFTGYYLAGITAIGGVGAYEKDVEISERVIGAIVGLGVVV